MRDDLSRELAETLENLPDQPGCYLHKAAGGEILYVGKARSLRSRVRSYFQPSAKHEPRIATMVSEVHSVEFIVTRSEIEALILENNLIKEHRPRFNVLLRDDKNFPYLKLDVDAEFPRVTLVRRPRDDRHLYFGPFLPTSHARRTLRMIPRYFGVANCHLRFDGKQRPCLYYHLDQCLAPCAGKADPGEYAERVAQVRLFLAGRNAELASTLREKMQEASRALDFERAARYRDMVKTIEHLAEKQGMSSVRLEHADFWAEFREGREAAVELFRMREGRIVGRREFTFEAAPEAETFYDTVLARFYAEGEVPPLVYVPRLPAERDLLESYLAQRRGGRVRIAAPSKGKTRDFLDLVARNARLAFESRFRARHVHGVRALEDLRDVLGLDEAPFRIEGFDVSHLGGDEPRASMVVFEGATPKKSDYRIYKLRTAAPGDDYKAMREVVGRRYARLLREEKRLPDLVLIDGGKGQLAAARLAIAELELESLPVISLAKREEEIFLEVGGEALLLDRHSPALRLVQQVRDEAHRFALRHHRRARSKATIRSSALTRIPGIGATTARRLLEQFGSVEGVRSASDDSLRAAVGPAKAAIVREGLAKAASAPE